MTPALLHIAIVTYGVDAELLLRVLQHLRSAANHVTLARQAPVHITLVDNGNDAALLRELLQRAGLAQCSAVVAAGSNLGYGKAHNLALARGDATYHLVMNPDVLVSHDALTLAIDFLDAHADVVALSPHALDGNGETAFLCKRYPAVIDLALRGFAPRSTNTAHLLRAAKQRKSP
jgi:GT2 family glycosyltransferase